MSRILKNADREDVLCLMVIFYGMAFGGVAVTTIIMGVAADQVGLPILAVILAVLASLAAIFGTRSIARRM